MKMNKRYKYILIFSCILVVILCILISSKSKREIVGKNKSWMSNISDDTKLTDIMIPGVHNAAASNIPLSLFAKCQDYSILNLLNLGYRYLDIRAGIDEVTGENRLILYHNFIPCYLRDGIIQRKLTFDEVLMSCYDFLKENPTETIIFMVKYEYGDLSVSEFEKLVDESIRKNSDKWLLTDKTPCLGEARGKIVLYRRYEDEALLGSKAGIECIWDEQEDTDIFDSNSSKDNLEKKTAWIQDMYKLTVNDKWDVFSYILNSISESDRINENYPIINFLSTTGRGRVGIPLYYAKILNKRFLDCDFDEDIHPQWIIVDFGDEKIAEKIIKTNKK